MGNETQSSIDKVLKILQILSKSPFEYKIAQVSMESDINRSTVHRILNKLLEDKWVMQNSATKKYMIGPMTYHVGSVYSSCSNNVSKILEVLDKASRLTEESVGYAIREGDMVISLYEMEMYQPLKMNDKPGTFYPINMGGYGKCLMAYYDQEKVEKLLDSQKFEKKGPNTLTEKGEILEEYRKIREKGFALSDEEKGPHIAGVSVPIFNKKGEVNSCIAMAFIKGIDYEIKVEKYLMILSDGAKELSKYML